MRYADIINAYSSETSTKESFAMTCVLVEQHSHYILKRCVTTTYGFFFQFMTSRDIFSAVDRPYALWQFACRFYALAFKTQHATNIEKCAAMKYTAQIPGLLMHFTSRQ